MFSDIIHSNTGTSRKLHFGIVLLPNFTLTAFSGFVDLLRLASDEGDTRMDDRFEYGRRRGC